MQKSEQGFPARAGSHNRGGRHRVLHRQELTKFTHDVVVVDKEIDVSDETTKANNAEVHSGSARSWDAQAEAQRPRQRHVRRVRRGLGVDFQRQGLLIVVTPRSLPENVTRWLPESVADFIHGRILPRVIMSSGKRKGIPGLRVVGREEILRLEPHVTKSALAGVFDQTYGMVAPYKLTIALAELAVINGAKMLLDTEVTGSGSKAQGQRRRHKPWPDRGADSRQRGGVCPTRWRTWRARAASRYTRARARASSSTGTSPATTSGAASRSSG